MRTPSEHSGACKCPRPASLQAEETEAHRKLEGILKLQEHFPQTQGKGESCLPQDRAVIQQLPLCQSGRCVQCLAGHCRLQDALHRDFISHVGLEQGMAQVWSCP